VVAGAYAVAVYRDVVVLQPSVSGRHIL
jgi:hypothetical protein